MLSVRIDPIRLQEVIAVKYGSVRAVARDPDCPIGDQTIYRAIRSGQCSGSTLMTLMYILKDHSFVDLDNCFILEEND